MVQRITTLAILVLAFMLYFFELVSAQSEYLPLDNSLNRKMGSKINSLSSQVHTSLQPYEVSRLGLSMSYDSLLRYERWDSAESRSWLARKIFNEHLFEVIHDDYSLWFDFLPDFGAGSDVADERATWLHTRAFEFGGRIGNTFSFRTQYYESYGKFPLSIDNFIKKTAIIPGQGYQHFYSPDAYEYDLSAGTISYTPSKYLNILFGQDKNFIGDGYRSLFLSDAAFNYPFLKLTGYVWDLQYSIMWAQFQEPIANGGLGELNYWPKKYGVFHYLDWNVTNRLSLGFFEAVMWKAADTTYGYGYRGFDLNYLNPLIFIRPIEYSMGSPDKMKLGLNGKYKASDQISFYGQLLLDEWVIGEYLHYRGYWANKYGLQFGMKGFDILKIKNLFLQTEFNTVSPYTYSAVYAPSYSHYEQPLADPLGANFFEWVAISNYRVNRFEFTAKVNIARLGADSGNVNYGGNIYLPYSTHFRDYGNYTTQGVKTDLSIADVRVAYILNPLINLRLELGVLIRNSIAEPGSNKSTWITFGIRSSFRNLYYDF